MFLHNRNVGVDEDIFGLRPLGRMLEILTEDKQDAEFFARLESFGIADLYRKGQWHKIHNVLTNSYLQALDTMNKTLSQHIRQDF
jgi:Tfp pilus assembly ATPase PilU